MDKIQVTALQEISRGKGAPPAYAQIAECLRAAVQDAEPGTQLPTTAEISEYYKVAAMTARQALIELVDAGEAVNEHGRGFFVAGTSETRENDGLAAYVTALVDALTTDATRRGLPLVAHIPLEGRGGRVLAAEGITRTRAVAEYRTIPARGAVTVSILGERFEWVIGADDTADQIREAWIAACNSVSTDSPEGQLSVTDWWHRGYAPLLQLDKGATSRLLGAVAFSAVAPFPQVPYLTGGTAEQRTALATAALDLWQTDTPNRPYELIDASRSRYQAERIRTSFNRGGSVSAIEPARLDPVVFATGSDPDSNAGRVWPINLQSPIDLTAIDNPQAAVARRELGRHFNSWLSAQHVTFADDDRTAASAALDGLELLNAYLSGHGMSVELHIE